MPNTEWSDSAFQKKWEERAKKMGRFNLAIFGKTGVGKSTLTNAVFGDEVATTGVGEPVTQENHLYIHRNGLLGIIDTRGLEIGKDSGQILKDLRHYMKAMRDEPLSQQAHVAWYCIRATDRRFEETEAQFIRGLHETGIPVVAVLTQVPSRDGAHHGDALDLANHIESLDLPIYGGRPILVMAKDDQFTGLSTHGLQDLIDATFHLAPEGAQAALIASQKVDMDRKHEKAMAAVLKYSGAAGAVGATPLPIADAPIIAGAQLGMMIHVAAIFGVKLETASFAAFSVTALATTLGRTAVAGLLKMIPGAGSVVGAVISGSIATVFTLAIGAAWVTVCKELAEGKLKGLDGELDTQAIRELFQTQLKHFLKNPPRKES